MSVFAFSLIGYTSTIKGLNKLEINNHIIKNDLENNFVVVSEALQTILRREGIQNAYEIFKDFTRNVSNIDRDTIIDFIDNLDVDNSIKDELKSVTRDFV